MLALERRNIGHGSVDGSRAIWTSCNQRETGFLHLTAAECGWRATVTTKAQRQSPQLGHLTITATVGVLRPRWAAVAALAQTAINLTSMTRPPLKATDEMLKKSGLWASRSSE